ncbi:MAG: septum formation inhibitor Maf [Candidatus Hydrogenedentes bacterium]|nr:septum formation inhibitor Maf [Candidatus Hydrogenedentota bacterium]
MKFILASSSPRRAQLLKSLGVRFTVVKPTAEEGHAKDAPPEEVVTANSEAKARSVAANLEGDGLVLGADTLVYLEGKAFGKPKDLEEARQMLRALSGNRHLVYTGLTVIELKTGKVLTGYERTGVVFRSLSDSDIEHYLQSVSPLDRAGAYTVEGPGSLLVKRFEGCYYNVVGLPLVKLDQMLRTLDLNLFHPTFQPGSC